MTVDELQNQLDALFPKGARVCVNPMERTAKFFVVGRPVAVSDNAIACGSVLFENIKSTFEATAPIEISDDSVHIQTSDGTVILDKKFFPTAGLLARIEEQRDGINEGIVASMREAHAQLKGAVA